MAGAGAAGRRPWFVDLRRRGLMIPALAALLALALIATALMAGGQINLPTFPAVVPPTPPPTSPVPTPPASPLATVAPSATPRTKTPGSGLLTLDGDVYLTDGDAGNRQKILDGDPWIDGRDNSGGWSGARWSGSGRYLAASRGDTTVVSRTDGTEKVRFDNGQFVWAPSGDRIYVGVDAGGRVEDLAAEKSWTIKPPAGSLFRDTPSFSPDGMHLVTQVCTACGSESDGPLDLWIFDIASGKHMILTHTPNDMEAWPVWSPDGKAIASWQQGCRPDANGDLVCGQDVYSVPADGGPELRITTDTLSATPIWSPDSRHLAFSIQSPIPDAANGTGGSGTAFVSLNDATSVPSEAPTRLVEPVNGVSNDPTAWSVDGQRIYVTRMVAVPQQDQQQPPTPLSEELWSYDLTGRDARSLAVGPGLGWDVH